MAASGKGEQVSQALDDMTCELIGSYLDELADGGYPGIVLCCEDAYGNRYEVAFTDDDDEACLFEARRFVERNASGIPSDHVGPIDRYAIAYTGGVEVDGVFEDALLVSFYERALTTGYSAYVLYRGVGAGDDFMWTDPEPAGEEPPLI